MFDDSEIVDDLLKNGYTDSKGKHKTTTSPKQTAVYKAWKTAELQRFAEQGLEIIEQTEMDMYERMRDGIVDNVLANDLIYGREGENEASFEFEEDCFKIAGKIDRKLKDCTVDLKKVADARYQKIKWDVERMNYDVQGVIYSRGNKSKKKKC